MRRLLQYLTAALLSLAAASGNSDAATQLVFCPAPNAPMGTRGTLDLVGPATLSINLQTLGPAAYEVTGLKRRAGSIVFLGRLSVADPTLTPSPKTGDLLREDNSTHQAQSLHAQAAIQLPAGLNVSDLSRVTITDLEGNEILTAIIP